MFKYNFHSHSCYDDGCCTLDSYIDKAVSKNFKVYGFSGHAPVPFNTIWHMKEKDLSQYIRTSKELKDMYKGNIEIYTGLETDFYPGCTDYRKLPGIDYTIGAIHFIINDKNGRIMDIDGTRESFAYNLKEYYDSNIHSLITAYYSKIREMFKTVPPDILAHFDVIKKNNYDNAFFNEDDEIYRHEVTETLKLISDTNTIIEVNTGGISRGYIKDAYPSKWILEICYDMGIPVMLASDSHTPENIDFKFNETIDLLKKIGFKKQRILYENQWVDIEL